MKGLCFQGFVECFFKLAVLMFDDATTDVESVKNLIYYCKFFLKLRDIKPNPFFSIELNLESAMTGFKPSTKLANMLKTQVQIMKNNPPVAKNCSVQRNTSVLSNNATMKYASHVNSAVGTNGANNSRLEKYNDEKKSLFPIFF